MSAAETIAKAIERLEEIGDELGWHGWSVQLPLGKPHYTGKPRIWRDDVFDGVAGRVPVLVLATVDADGYWGQYTADAIVTLHRTIDAQLAILRDAEKDCRTADSEYEERLCQDLWRSELALAEAILGGDR